jgi:transposase
VRQLDRQLADLQCRITRAVTQGPTTLPELVGIGLVLAAKLLGEVSEVGRFATKAQFAFYTGTTPIEASTPAGRSCATGCRGLATGSSTMRCT